ncbi:uncharacterized protein C8Q71DRAFT_778695 [Rhodofomes roseus]|uniref:Uncharacterized protein n=1 Tax=Rhodofomes roseus TaxID=34475 RepID=A0ABQ8K4Q3_9APHY|nr:uncharacterized protein C8Q71DRAFT_778695 [Rhodofomes roseus]KAH9831940.1 hypothetical protein C8Q71DRAFT_778695 [Rhodofomes roseus]
MQTSSRTQAGHSTNDHLAQAASSASAFPLTTESLNAARPGRMPASPDSQNQAMGVRLIWLTFQARVSKKLDTRLGMHMAAYEDNLLIEDIIARVLEIWNTTWVGKYPKALRRDEVLLRFEGNKLPIPGSDILLLADFYRLHTTGANKEIYVPKTRIRKIPP